MIESDAPREFDDRRAIPKLTLQLGEPVVNQIIADMSVRARLQVALVTLPCQFDGAARDIKFTGECAPGDAFDHMAITVACRKIHLRVCARRIGAKNRFGETDAFDETLPVDCRKQPHASDNVTDRHLRGGLALMLKLNNLLDTLPPALRLALDPFDERQHVRVLVAQTLCQLNNKRAVCL